MSQKVIYPSAARTATPTAVDIGVGNRAKFLKIVIDTTAIGAAPSTVVTVDMVDSLSGKLINLLTSAAIVGVGTITLNVGPGLPATANVSANAALGDTIRITATHGNGNSHTYSVSAHLIR